MSSDKWRENSQTTEPDTEIDPLPNRYLRLTFIFAAVVGLGLVGSWIFNTDDPEIATIGKQAPAFEVRSFENDEPLSLTDLTNDEGRPIVINFMASWCAPCREEIPEINAFAADNPNVIVVGIAVEDVYEDYKRFVEEVGPTYPTAFDDGPMRVAYQTLGLPATYFLDSTGKIVDVFNGILNQEVLEDRIADVS